MRVVCDLQGLLGEGPRQPWRSATHLDFEEVQKIQNQVQRVSHSVTFNQDGSFTCRRRYEAVSTPEQFAIDIKGIMTAARRGKIQILEKTIERLGRDTLYVVVRFKPLR